MNKTANYYDSYIEFLLQRFCPRSERQGLD